MKSLTLENFYHKINDHIIATQSFLQSKTFAFLVKSCRLRPYPIVFEKYENVKIHKQWIDEYHNSLIINKIVKERYNDLTIESAISTTDLYYGLSLDKIYKISKLMFLYVGKEEDSADDFIVISLLGIDNYWRTYYIYDNELNNCSPLVIGYKNLTNIIEKLDIKAHEELKIIGDIILKCGAKKAWLSYCPVQEEFLNDLKQHNFAYDLIKSII